MRKTTSKLPLLLMISSVSAGLAFAAGCSRSSDTDSGSSDIASSPDLVISQVYGSGGNQGAVFTNDYVELFNRGAAAANLAGKSLQYTAATGNFTANSNILALPAVAIEPGHYFLVQLAHGTNGAALPTPDFDSTADGGVTLSLSGTQGKIALVTTPLDACGSAAAPCALDAVLDFVGYGTTASQAEGAPTPTLGAATAAIRSGAGCNDTGNNAADFSVAAPAPRTSGNAAVLCGDIDASVPEAGPVDEAGMTDDASVPDSGRDAGKDAGKDSGTPKGPVVLLNELEIDPPGDADGAYQFVELLCVPKLALDHIYFVAISGQPSAAPGTANVVVDLSGKTCGDNGLVLVKAASGGHASGAAQTTLITTAAFDSAPLRKDSATFMLVRSNDPIVQGNDYDTADNGTLALPAGATILDSIATALPDDASTPYTYGARLADGAYAALIRPVGNTMPTRAASWYGGKLSGNDIAGTAFDVAHSTANLPPTAVLTPGAANVLPGQIDPNPGGALGGDTSTTPSGGTTGTAPPSATDPTTDDTSGGAKKPGLLTRKPTASDGGCSAAPIGQSPRGIAGFAMLALSMVALLRRRRQ